MSDTKRIKAQPTETVVAREFDQVMICYPNPDIVCLEGGCTHCDDSGTWWMLEALQAYAYERDHHHLKAYWYGSDHGWHNRPKKLGDAGEIFHGVG